MAVSHVLHQRTPSQAKGTALCKAQAGKQNSKWLYSVSEGPGPVFAKAMGVHGKSDGAPLLHAEIFNQSSEEYSTHQPSPVEAVLGTIT